MRRTLSAALGTVLLLANTVVAQTPVAVIPGIQPGEAFGSSPVSLGDVNGDGVADVAVGAPSNSWNPGVAGSVRVLSGFDFQVLYAVTGAPGENFGLRIARLGDVDGDGVADFVASAPMNGVIGAVGYVRTISGATGAVLRTTVAPGPSANFGDLLAAGGDFDGDGYGDFVASSFAATQKLAVYSGLTGAMIFAVGATTYGPMHGPLRAAFLSDRNGDGFDELLIGNPHYCGAPTPCSWPSGAVFLAGGPNGVLLSASYSPLSSSDQLGANVAEIGDLDGDGFTEVVFAKSPMNLLPFPGSVTAHHGVTGAALWTVHGIPPTGYPGGHGLSIVDVGDVDDDGVPDVALGSTGMGGGLGGGQSGHCVISGATGTAISSMTATTGYVGAAGDLTGDGFPEWFVGEPTADLMSTDSGALYVYSGAVQPTASVVALGGGCGALPGGPLLAATPPALGQTMQFTLSNGPAFAAGNLVFDVGLDVATPLFGCTLHLDPARLATWILLPIGLDAAGGLAFGLPLAPTPLLAGLPVTVQAFLLGTPSPLGFDLSNGLRTILGY
jgi:hypothetical protein